MFSRICHASAATLVMGSVACANTLAVPAENAAPAAPQTLYIREIRVLGAKELAALEVQEAVYPFLGPGRTLDDVEQARAALEKAYQAKGFQGAAVQVPPQRGRGGVIFLQVTTGTVAKLRVQGSRYYLPSAIKARAQSLAEGRALNFNDVQRDIVALNQLPDRQVTPELKPGVEPGTVEVDLNVKDKFPLHASVELNNRNNPGTTSLRLNFNANYNNLWQLGHTAGFGYQVAPERRLDAEIYSAYYIARFPGVENFSLMLQGRKQNSNITNMVSGFGEDLTLSGINSNVAPGENLGLRAIWTLPPLKDFYHSVTAGLDYNHFRNSSSIKTPTGTINIASDSFVYYALSANYGATWAPKGSTTDLNVGVTMGLRGPGSSVVQFENNRFDARTNFIKLKGELSHTRDLPYGTEGFMRVEGQLSDQPLVNTEQFAAGGLTSVRGYLEGEFQSDNGVTAQLELRSPNLLGWIKQPEGTKKEDNEWRFYFFGDVGAFGLRSGLPETDDSFTLASYGIGTRMRVLGHLSGSLDAAIPVFNGPVTEAGNGRLIFRVSGDF
jgi:hemolysin activation/secretion protein